MAQMLHLHVMSFERYYLDNIIFEPFTEPSQKLFLLHFLIYALYIGKFSIYIFYIREILYVKPFQ